MLRDNLSRVLVLTTLLLSPIAVADGEVTPNPRTFHFVGVPVTHGTGCPTGSVETVVADDGKTMTLIFSELVAEAGPGIALSANRKQCTTNAKVHVPAGFSFAIVNVDHRGFAQLDPKVISTQKSTYYIMGDAVNRATAFTTVEGPEYLDGADWVVRDEFALPTIVWSACGVETNFNVTSAVQVNNNLNRKGRGLMVQDGSDARFETVFNLIWRRCS